MTAPVPHIGGMPARGGRAPQAQPTAAEVYAAHGQLWPPGTPRLFFSPEVELVAQHAGLLPVLAQVRSVDRTVRMADVQAYAKAHDIADPKIPDLLPNLTPAEAAGYVDMMAAHGAHLIPLKPLEKDPLEVGWNSAPAISRDEAIAHLSAGGNLGWDVGRSRKVIVDCEDAESTRAMIAAGFHPSIATANGLDETSPKHGGRHFVFTAPDGVPDAQLRSKMQVPLGGGKCDILAAPYDEVPVEVALMGGEIRTTMKRHSRFAVAPGSQLFGARAGRYGAHAEFQAGETNGPAPAWLWGLGDETAPAPVAELQGAARSRERREYVPNPNSDRVTQAVDAISWDAWLAHDTAGRLTFYADDSCGCGVYAYANATSGPRSAILHDGCEHGFGAHAFSGTLQADWGREHGSRLQLAAFLADVSEPVLAKRMGVDLGANPLQGVTLEDLGVRPIDGDEDGAEAGADPDSAVWMVDELAKIERESEIWDKTPFLRKVDAAARSHGVGNWALLGALLPRVACTIPYWVRLVGRSGMASGSASGSSVNLFTILLADPEGGKSELIKLAEALIPLPGVAPTGLGTGEGLLKDFAHTEKNKRERQDTSDGEDDETHEGFRLVWHNHHVMLTTAEAALGGAEASRTGTKATAIQRSMWMGEDVTSPTGDVDKRVRLAPHSYRLGIVIGAQLDLDALGWIYREGKLGTPQRYTPVPAVTTEPIGAPVERIPLPVIDWTGGRGVGHSYTELMGEPAPVFIHRPPAAEKFFRDARRRSRERQLDAFSTKVAKQRAARDNLLEKCRGHEGLHQFKVAAVLAAADGLTQPTDDHWAAAGAWMAMREVMMVIVTKILAEHIAAEDARKGRSNGRSRAAAKVAQAETEDAYRRDVAQRVVAVITEAGKPMSESAIDRVIGDGQGAILPEVLRWMVDADLLANGGLNAKRNPTFAVAGVTPGFDRAPAAPAPAAPGPAPVIGVVGQRAA